jgi:16S rRNA processing protein RimM
MPMQGNDLYLPLICCQTYRHKFYFHSSGFEVEDSLRRCWKIESINDTTAQPLFEVLNGDVEIYPYD